VGLAAFSLAVSLLGFIVLPAGTPVPHQFNLEGWTTYSDRNIALLGFSLAALFTGWVSHYLAEAAFPWLRWLGPAAMLLLMGVQVSAILHVT
jgi:hypothetical protein